MWYGNPPGISEAEKIRQITRRNRGVSLAQVIVELNLFLVGWVTYYRYAACRFDLQCLDEWIRRKLRCYRLKQRKRTLYGRASPATEVSPLHG